jgi:CheY-like chemotaxis protein
MAKTILIADDDATVTKLFSLDAEGKNVDIVIRSSSNGEDTIDSITRTKPDIVVLDIRMSKGDGFSVLDHMKKNNMEIPVVILTNYRNDEYLEKSKAYGNVKDYLVKHQVRMDRVIDTVTGYLS